MRDVSAYVEISLDNLIFNLNQVRKLLAPGASIIAVVKDCAYGCGAVPVSRALEREGVGFFAVARMEEARDLRENGISSPVLVLGECTKEEVTWAAAENVHVTLNSLTAFEVWKEAGCRVRVHVNVDTGMGRMGILESEIDEAVRIFLSGGSFVFEGIFTHFASADRPGTDTVARQQGIFESAVRRFSEKGLSPRYIHSPNSAALIRFPLPAGHLVRPGIALYGCKPDPCQDFGIELRNVAGLKAPVVKIKKVPSGTPVSYGGTYVTDRETHIATIPLGYAHGLPRLLSNKGEVLIRGKRYRIAGNVTMDYIMADAGPNPEIRVGDEAVAMGFQGEDCITTDEVARHCRTIGYEILCGLSRRTDRFYLQAGKVLLHQKGCQY